MTGRFTEPAGACDGMNADLQGTSIKIAAMKYSLPLVSLLLLVSGCSATGPASPGGPGSLPASFAGALPCADCEAIDCTLDLLADRSYHLAMRYRGKGDAVFEHGGAWEQSADGEVLTLQAREPLRFAIEGPDALRLLDRSGAPIVSSLNYTLERVPNAALAGTRWRLTHLGRVTTKVADDPCGAHIVLDGAGRVAGSDGCNRIGGGYRLEGDKLAFSQLSSTRMACAEGMEQAQRFALALGSVARYRIAGAHLELLDRTGASQARFEAVP